MDPTQDWLLRMIYRFSEGLVARHSKDEEGIPLPTNSVKDEDMLSEILATMIRCGKLDEAENLLFRCVENFPLAENYAIGLEFYRSLAELPEDKLRAYGWSRQEIQEGLEDFHFLIFKEPLALNDFNEEDT